MLKIGVVSDSHGSQFYTEQFVTLAKREKFDVVYHLGDGEGEARYMSKRLPVRFIGVAGNCDVYSDAPAESLETHEGHTFLALHGHRQDVKWGLTRLSYYAEDKDAHVALYGHTHVPQVEYVGRTLTVNPGSLARGRYAVIEIDGDRVTPFLKTL